MRKKTSICDVKYIIKTPCDCKALNFSVGYCLIHFLNLEVLVKLDVDVVTQLYIVVA